MGSCRHNAASQHRSSTETADGETLVALSDLCKAYHA